MEHLKTLVNKSLNIRYVKLKFTITMENDCILPKHKPSMLRGGIGEMLLRANCIRDRNCSSCDFMEECIVQRTMYSRFINKPSFVSEGDSIGYVLECESHKTSFEAGEKLSFFLILFGKTIVYFSQYLNAIYTLGNYGLGKDHAHFQIQLIQNSYGKHILDGNNVYMESYTVENVSDYVARRMKELDVQTEANLVFHSPVSIKYEGNFLRSFRADALIRSLARRIYALDCFEENGAEQLDVRNLGVPVISEQKYDSVQVARFSNRKQQKIYLNGIVGNARLTDVSEDVLKLLLAGEILHVGKNTSFGFGRYMIER